MNFEYKKFIILKKIKDFKFPFETFKMSVLGLWYIDGNYVYASFFGAIDNFPLFIPKGQARQDNTVSLSW